MAIHRLIHILVVAVSCIAASQSLSSPIISHGRVRLTDVSEIILHRKHMTVGVRERPRLQFRPRLWYAEEDKEHEPYDLRTIQCYNRGINERTYQWDWECEADLPDGVKFGVTHVTCEGYDHPEDPYIVYGSCGLVYELLDEDTGEKSDDTGEKSDDNGEKSDDTGEKSDDTGKNSDDTGKQSENTEVKTDGSETLYYWLKILFIAVVIVICMVILLEALESFNDKKEVRRDFTQEKKKESRQAGNKKLMKWVFRSLKEYIKKAYDNPDQIPPPPDSDNNYNDHYNGPYNDPCTMAVCQAVAGQAVAGQAVAAQAVAGQAIAGFTAVNQLGGDAITTALACIW